MQRNTLLAVVVLGLGAAACHNGYTAGESPAPSGSGYEASGTNTPGMARVVALQSVNNSGLTGTAELVPQGGMTVVTVTLAPAAGDSAAGQSHAEHIHTGTCDAPGPVVAPLKTITGTEQGYEVTKTDVSVSLSTLTDGKHIIAAHASGDEQSAVIACAPITTM